MGQEDTATGFVEGDVAWLSDSVTLCAAAAEICRGGRPLELRELGVGAGRYSDPGGADMGRRCQR